MLRALWFSDITQYMVILIRIEEGKHQWEFHFHIPFFLILNSCPIRIFQHPHTNYAGKLMLRGCLKEEKAQHKKEEPIRLAKETAYEPCKSFQTKYNWNPLKEQASHPWLPNKTLILMLELSSSQIILRNPMDAAKYYILESLFIGNERIEVGLLRNFTLL